MIIDQQHFEEDQHSIRISPQFATNTVPAPDTHYVVNSHADAYSPLSSMPPSFGYAGSAMYSLAGNPPLASYAWQPQHSPSRSEANLAFPPHLQLDARAIFEPSMDPALRRDSTLSTATDASSGLYFDISRHSSWSSSSPLTPPEHVEYTSYFPPVVHAAASRSLPYVPHSHPPVPFPDYGFAPQDFAGGYMPLISPPMLNGLTLKSPAMSAAAFVDDEATPTATRFPELSVPVRPTPTTMFHSSYSEPTEPLLDEENACNQIRQYLRLTDKRKAGQRAVILYTPVVGTKSYSNEQRTIVPPFSAVCLGDDTLASSSSLAVTLEIEGDSNPRRQCKVNWISPKGVNLQNANQRQSDFELIVAAKAIADDMYLAKHDEHTRTARILGNVRYGNEYPLTDFVLEVEAEPIKAISKASRKKSTTRGTDTATTYINHGSTIALFTRKTAQGSSARYLTTSQNRGAFPAYDWHALTGSAAYPWIDQLASDENTFESRADAWDPFIIYLANPYAKSNEAWIADRDTTFPSPPQIVLPVDPNKGRPIHVNQMVILQCLSSGAVSPVFVLRDVVKTMACGDFNPEARPALNDAVPFGEALGEPVSQLQKVAFELYEPQDVENARYFTCIEDTLAVVSISAGPKQTEAIPMPVNLHESPIPSPRAVPVSLPSEAFWPEQVFGATSNPALTRSMCASPSMMDVYSYTSDSQSIVQAHNLRSRAASISQMPSPAMYTESFDGGRVRRRKSSAPSITSSLSRGMKTSSIPGRSRKNSALENMFTQSKSGGPRWTCEIAHRSIWVLAGINITRYQFVPGTMQAGQTLTLPVVKSMLAPPSSTALALEMRTITGAPSIRLEGKGFTTKLSVWFNDIPSPKVIIKSEHILLASIPTFLSSSASILIRLSNGTIVHTPFIYQPQPPFSSTL